MTASQREAWSEDANAYVADEEEETCTARVSGELLLDELCGVSEGGREKTGRGCGGVTPSVWIAHCLAAGCMQPLMTRQTSLLNACSG